MYQQIGKPVISTKVVKYLISAFAAAALLFVAADRAHAGGLLSIAFDPVNFDDIADPLVVDNPYLPLNPLGYTGGIFTYEAETEDGCIREMVTILGLRSMPLNGAAPYNGLEVLEVQETGEFQEDCAGAWVKEEHTFDWYRQDEFGNIWYLGELSRSYEDDCSGYAGIPNEIDRAANPECYEGSWEAGKAPAGGGIVAQAGIVVPSNLPTGDPNEPLTPGTFYFQELAEEAMDVAKVLKTDSMLKLKDDGGTEVLLHCRTTKEYTTLQPGAVEQKSYCPDDDGLVLIEEISGGKTVLVFLTSIVPGTP